MKKYTETDIKDYVCKLTLQQANRLLEHCNKFEIEPDIVAWYEDKADFYSDWTNSKDVNYTREEAQNRYDEGTKNTGEFCKFANGEIVRLKL